MFDLQINNYAVKKTFVVSFYYSQVSQTPLTFLSTAFFRKAPILIIDYIAK